MQDLPALYVVICSLNMQLLFASPQETKKTTLNCNDAEEWRQDLRISRKNFRVS
jgi:hypothetical protein